MANDKKIVKFKKIRTLFPFSRFKYYKILYDDIQDLYNVIITLHAAFNSTTIVFKTFRNQFDSFGLLESFHYKNYSYYIIPNVDFIKEVDLLRILYLEISLFESPFQIEKLDKSVLYFSISIDNFAENPILLINKKLSNQVDLEIKKIL